MDRTQYGKVTVADTYRPYDIICKHKPLPGYALLADLQTNLSKSTPAPTPHQQTSQTTTIITTNYPNPKTEAYQTSSPTAQHQTNVYQNEEVLRVNNQAKAQNLHNGFHDAQGNVNPVLREEANYTNTYQSGPAKEQMYRHETREEVRTETRSSGPNPPPNRSVISNNLSELDSLLQDLNTSKQSAVYKETKVVNGSRPSVDSLLDELNSVGHGETEKRSSQQETRVHQTTSSSTTPLYTTNVQKTSSTTPLYTTNVQKMSQVSASNATKELDDLMESLSDFKGESKILRKDTRLITEHTHKSSSENQEGKTISVTETPAGTPPPRPPRPAERDILPVPPPRPPAPNYVTVEPEDVPLPATLPLPPTPSPPPGVVSVVYRQQPQQQQQIHGSNYSNTTVLSSPGDKNPTTIKVNSYTFYNQADSILDDPINRPPSGGPVKRNDAEYRWVTDQIKHAVREVVEAPCSVDDSINASSLQSQVDTAYAKPIPKLKQTPSPPPPAPKPSPPNQLDSMLGSLTSHMTEQGVNTTQKGCCCACDKPIVGQVITALGKTWHPEHFTCTHCREELGTKNFFERDGKPYCEPDYHKLFSPKCCYCSGPILDKCVTAMNKTWHPEHFFCAQCGNTFGEEGFHEKNGKPYCKSDYFNMFAPKCGGCNNPIMENYISALNGQWHPECFVCRDCKQCVARKAFYEMEGKPVCGECLGIDDDDEEGEEEEDED